MKYLGGTFLRGDYSREEFSGGRERIFPEEIFPEPAGTDSHLISGFLLSCQVISP